MLGVGQTAGNGMRSFQSTRRAALYAALGIALGALAACAAPEKPKEEPSKDTFECTLDGERWVVRFTEGEARLLTPAQDRVTLYQIPAASGVRYSNGIVELRGKGMELTLISDGTARALAGCKPVMVPVAAPSPFPWLNPPPPR
jgi:membrane-bound inhibitor of C-type lysozyme